VNVQSIAPGITLLEMSMTLRLFFFEIHLIRVYIENLH